MKVRHPKSGKVVVTDRHGDYYLSRGWEEVKEGKADGKDSPERGGASSKSTPARSRNRKG